VSRRLAAIVVTANILNCIVPLTDQDAALAVEGAFLLWGADAEGDVLRFRRVYREAAKQFHRLVPKWLCHGVT